MLNKLFHTAVITSLLFVSGVSARQVEDWPYERLFKEADVVVIASASRSIPNEQSWQEKHFDQKRFLGVETKLHVIASVKGRTAETINLQHFHYAPDASLLNDGPGLVTLLTGSVSVVIQSTDSEPLQEKAKGLSSSNVPQYLLFLKRFGDGQYAPVSGQLDADLSVRALFELRAFQR